MNSEEILPLPRKYEDLSTDAVQQIRFYCDRCGEGFVSAEVPVTESRPKASLEDMVVDEMQALVFRCPQCKLWVCRDNCWEPIQCICEGCSRTEMRQAETLAQPNSRTQSLYSSILGSVCSGCQMALPPNATVCPECGQKL